MKIVILGAAGGIGQALALLLKIKLPKNAQLYLYDIAVVTPGIAMDLKHIPNQVKVKGFCVPEDITLVLEGADIILIAAGIARKPGMEREDLFKINAEILSKLVNEISETAPRALIGIITNPINSMVVIAAEILKKKQVYDRNRLFGITTLDNIRAQAFIAEMKNKYPHDIQVSVVGGHSSATMVPLLSQVKHINFSKQEIYDLTNLIKNAGTEVVLAKQGYGSATLAMSYAAASFTMSLVQALQGIDNIIVQAYVEGDGKYTRFFTQPVLLGKNGIAKFKNIGMLSLFEKQTIEDMLGILRREIHQGESYIINKSIDYI